MTKIDWTDETINPLGHGCYGTGTKENPKICPYCYAAKMAKRNMRGCRLCAEFTPYTHFEQLDKLKQWKKPKTVFVQSMGDLFGKWVSEKWIKEVFKACEAAPQHRYLFLTKNPSRYVPLADKCIIKPNANMWYGTTITNEKELRTSYPLNAELFNTFLSIEPIQEHIILDTWFVDINLKPIWKWVIIGAETGNRKNKIVPERKWIKDMVNDCRNHNTPVFMKSNIKDIWNDTLIQEYPWK